MAGKLTQLALLTAGLFLSTSVHAEFECLALAGSLEDFLTIPKSSNSGCPDTYRRTVGGSECILEKYFGSSGDAFLCSQFDTYFIGGPYRYTGSAHNPDPQEPEPQPSLNVDVPDNPVPPAIQLTGDFAIATNNTVAAANNVNKNLSDFSKKNDCGTPRHIH